MFNCIFVNMCNYTKLESAVVPLGQLSLATLVKNKLKEVTAEVLDLKYVYQSGHLKIHKDVMKMIQESVDFILMNGHVDLVSIYTMCDTHHFAIIAANEMKKKSPQTTVCLAGPQATITAKQTLEKYAFIDFIALGEGELTVEKIINGVKKKNYGECVGIAYREQEKIIVKPNTELVADLDDLPYIDYGLLNFTPKDKISIEVGRGCPFSCKFCSTSEFWKHKYRIKSPERIFSELEELYKKFGITKYAFEHDLFLVDKKVVLKLCELISKLEYSIEWGCSSRLDYIDEELLEAMSKAGCNSIYFGIETGSENLQKKINKNLNLSNVQDIVKMLKKYMIFPTFSFIYGFPGESEDDINKTLSLMYELYEEYHENYFKSNTYIQLHKLIFLPETTLTRENINILVQKNNLRTEIQCLENEWMSNEINEMLQDRQIFPQFFGMDKIENTDLVDLDIFFGFVFRNIIDYLDCTYKALLKYYKSHLKLYMALYEMNGSDAFSNAVPKAGVTIGDITLSGIEMFNKLITNTYFNFDTKIITDIFGFEYAIFQQAHDTTNRFKKIIDFSYDVIKMKRERRILYNKCEMTLCFENSGGEKKINRLR